MFRLCSLVFLGSMLVLADATWTVFGELSRPDLSALSVIVVVIGGFSYMCIQALRVSLNHQ